MGFREILEGHLTITPTADSSEVGVIFLYLWMVECYNDNEVMSMIVTFCGYSRGDHDEAVYAWLIDTLRNLIAEGAEIFYLGGYGSFDLMAAGYVNEVKKDNPSIRSSLVQPYIDREYDTAPYDKTLYPALESVPPLFAISKRNEWMVSSADVVVAYVTHDWGGVSATLDFAARCKKRTIQRPKT